MQTETPEELAEFAMDYAIELTGSSLGFVGFINEQQDELAIYRWSKNAMQECGVAEKHLVLPIAETGLLGEPVRRREPLIINDYSAPHPLKHGLPQGHAPIKRYLSLPVIEGDKVRAVVGVANKPSDYTEWDVAQLQVLMDGMWGILTRRRAEEELRASREFVHATMDSLSAQICVLDGEGRIIAVNQAWRNFAKEKPALSGEIAEGADYLKACEAAQSQDRETALAFAQGIREVMEGRRKSFELEYLCTHLKKSVGL